MRADVFSPGQKRGPMSDMTHESRALAVFQQNQGPVHGQRQAWDRMVATYGVVLLVDMQGDA
jgi:hypothetical protein